MGDLSKLGGREKVWFLLDALLDAAHALNKHDPDAAARYIGYVQEVLGEMEEQEPSP